MHADSKNPGGLCPGQLHLLSGSSIRSLPTVLPAGSQSLIPSELIAGRGAEVASTPPRVSLSLLRANPVSCLGIIIPDGGGLGVTQPVAVPSIVSGINQEGVSREHQQVPWGEVPLVILAGESGADPRGETGLQSMAQRRKSTGETISTTRGRLHAGQGIGRDVGYQAWSQGRLGRDYGRITERTGPVTLHQLGLALAQSGSLAQHPGQGCLVLLCLQTGDFQLFLVHIQSTNLPLRPPPACLLHA